MSSLFDPLLNKLRTDGGLGKRITVLEDANATNWNEYWESIASGTSGTLTIPDGHEILLDQWANGVDAVISKIVDGVPTGEVALDSGGDPVTTTLDATGAWVLSAAPTAYPVAIVFAARSIASIGINYANPIPADSTGPITPVDGAYYTSTASSVTLVSVGDERFCPASLNDSGTTDGITASKLVDSTQDFDDDGTEVGDVVLNTTDSTRAEITAIDSATTLSISADIMVSGENYEIHKGNRVIWGMGASAAAVLTVDPASLVAGNTFAIQMYCGESKVIGYDGTDFEKIGGVPIPLVGRIGDNATATPLTVAEDTDVAFPMVTAVKDNSSQMVNLAGDGRLDIIRPGEYLFTSLLKWLLSITNDQETSIKLYKNGAFENAVIVSSVSPLSRNLSSFFGGVSLAAGDYCSVYARQTDRGGSADLTISRDTTGRSVNWFELEEKNPW